MLTPQVDLLVVTEIDVVKTCAHGRVTGDTPRPVVCCRIAVEIQPCADVVWSGGVGDGVDHHKAVPHRRIPYSSDITDEGVRALTQSRVKRNPEVYPRVEPMPDIE